MSLNWTSSSQPSSKSSIPPSSAPDGMWTLGSECAGKVTRAGGGLVDFAGKRPTDVVAVVVVVGVGGKM